MSESDSQVPVSTEQALEQARRIAHQAGEVAEVSTEISLTSATDAVAVKADLARQNGEYLRQVQQIREAEKALKARMDAELAALRAQLAPMEAQVAKLKEVAWSVNLYLGRDEEIVPIRDGTPADTDEPIVIRQTVLYMDEESLLFADDDGMNMDDINAFDEWLVQDENLDRLLPEVRGVVALQARRRARETRYGGGVDDDHKTWWLLRNGERLFRMQTDLRVGEHLVPRADEFTSFFSVRGFDGTTRQILPGTGAWQQAEQKAGEQQRHFMRIAMVLQGLLDRTTVFRPLPEGLPVSFLTPASYESGRIVFLTDAEKALGTGHRPFRQWLRETNAEITEGMRIVGSFGYSSDFRSHDYERMAGNSRLRPESMSDRPASNQVYLVEKSGKELCIRFDRTELVRKTDEWGRGYWGEPERRGTCIIKSDDSFFVCIDAADPTEMRALLSDRTSRADYMDMVPLIQAALELISAEEIAEAPFRQLLAGRIAEALGIDLNEAAAQVPALVKWWKTKNKTHRALVQATDPALEAKATTEIVDRAVFLASFGDKDAKAAADLKSRAGVLMVARKTDGSYVAFARQPRRYDLPVYATTDPYLSEITRSISGRKVETREWITLSRSRLNRLHVLWADPSWSAVPLVSTPGDVPTDAEIETMLGQVLTAYPDPIAVQVRKGYAHDHAQLKVVSAISTENGRVVATSRSFFFSRGSDRLMQCTQERYSDSLFDPSDLNRNVLIQDEVKVRQWQALVQVEKDRRDEIFRLQQLTYAYAQKLRAAVEAEKEKAAYERFLEDYAAPELWEGHRKTIRIEVSRAENTEIDALRDHLLKALQAGQQVAGKRVGEFFEAPLTGHLIVPDLEVEDA